MSQECLCSLISCDLCSLCPVASHTPFVPFGTALSAQDGNVPRERVALSPVLCWRRNQDEQSVGSTLGQGSVAGPSASREGLFNEMSRGFLPGACCKAGLFLITMWMSGFEADFHQLP